jgi:hypothetical protein
MFTSAWSHEARSGIIYIRGDSEPESGNAYAKVVLQDSGDLLHLRIPDLVAPSGTRLRDLSGGEEWVEIPLVGFVYGRDELVAAQVPLESAAEARARWHYDRAQWPAIEPLLAESHLLIEATGTTQGGAPPG